MFGIGKGNPATSALQSMPTLVPDFWGNSCSMAHFFNHATHVLMARYTQEVAEMGHPPRVHWRFSL